jgi:pimeloyl-ACP methyl ester carboxylesterase
MENLLKTSPRLKNILTIGFKVVAWAALVSLLVVLTLFTFPTKNLSVEAFETFTFTESLDKIDSVKADENQDINPDCQTQVRNQGRQTDISIILFHGFTSCPKQFSKLADDFFAAGYNVYIPRLPAHGKSDLMTESLASLTPEILIQSMQESVQIASGLGQEVRVMGISGGANLAAAAAYYNPVVTQVVISSPLFSPLNLPTYSQKFAVNTIKVLPNQFRWWDDEVQNNRTEGPMHAYPRFSTKGIGAYVEIGIQLKRDLEQGRFEQDKTKVILTTVQGDQAVNNSTAAEYLSLWQKGGANVDSFSFNSQTGLGHDYIDPDQPFARIDLVYPVLTGYLLG